VRTNLPLLLWIARDDAFRAGETTTSFLDRRLDESIFTRTEPPNEAVLLAAAALLVDGRAPWRVGDVGLPLRLAHGDSIAELIADATTDSQAWRISGDRDGELRAQRRESVVHANFDDASVSGAVTYGSHTFNVHLDGRAWSFTFAPPPSTDATGGAHGAVAGAHVTAPMPGKIVKVAVREGEAVEERALLVVLEAMKMEHRIEAPAAAVVSSVLVKEGQIVAAATPLVTLNPSSSVEA
jgi:3-methylcrotonyl-CoA carboxylase alpha subunit